MVEGVSFGLVDDGCLQKLSIVVIRCFLSLLVEWGGCPHDDELAASILEDFLIMIVELLTVVHIIII